MTNPALGQAKMGMSTIKDPLHQNPIFLHGDANGQDVEWAGRGVMIPRYELEGVVCAGNAEGVGVKLADVLRRGLHRGWDGMLDLRQCSLQEVRAVAFVVQSWRTRQSVG